MTDHVVEPPFSRVERGALLEAEMFSSASFGNPLAAVVDVSLGQMDSAPPRSAGTARTMFPPDTQPSSSTLARSTSGGGPTEQGCECGQMLRLGQRDPHGRMQYA